MYFLIWERGQEEYPAFGIAEEIQCDKGDRSACPQEVLSNEPPMGCISPLVPQFIFPAVLLTAGYICMNLPMGRLSVYLLKCRLQ